MKYSFCVFIRSKKNAGGSESIQIIEKRKGKYRVLKTIGVAKTEEEKKKLLKRAEFSKRSENRGGLPPRWIATLA